MSTIKGILFDWGHTLVSVGREDCIWQACSEDAIATLERYGHLLPDGAAQDLKEHFGSARLASRCDPEHRETNFEYVLRDWCSKHVGKPVDGRALLAAAHAFWTNWTNCLDLLEQADGVLSDLKQRSYRLGLCSNVVAPRRYCEVQLERLGVSRYFDSLTFSSEVGLRKPHEAIFSDALAKLSQNDGTLSAAEVLFVGDSPLYDIVGAAQLGMPTALITHPDIELPWPEEDYHGIEPTYRISALSELTDLL